MSNLSLSSEGDALRLSGQFHVALILHTTAAWTPHASKINQINASPGRARTRMTTYEHLCISSSLGSDGLSAKHTQAAAALALIFHRRYLSVRLCPSKAASSSSSSTHLFSRLWLQCPRSPFTWPHAHTSPLPLAWLIRTQSRKLWHFLLQNITKYCALSSKIYNLTPLFFLRPLISLAGSIRPAPSSCAPSMRAIRATLSCWSGGAAGLRAN